MRKIKASGRFPNPLSGSFGFFSVNCGSSHPSPQFCSFRLLPLFLFAPFPVLFCPFRLPSSRAAVHPPLRRRRPRSSSSSAGAPSSAVFVPAAMIHLPGPPAFRPSCVIFRVRRHSSRRPRSCYSIPHCSSRRYSSHRCSSRPPCSCHPSSGWEWSSRADRWR